MHKHIALLFLTLSLAACAGMGRVYEADQIKPVREVAIIAVEVTQPAEFDPFKPSAGDTGTPLGNANYALSKPSAHVQDFYEDLRTALKKQYKWNVISLQTVSENTVYKKTYHDTTTGFQSSTPVGQNVAKFKAPGIIDMDAIRNIGPEGRDKILQALKVDAVVAVQYDIQLSGNSIMGIGNRYPKTNLRFVMYKRGQEAPIWQDYVEGQKMEESIGKTAITLNFGKMQELALKSAKKAYAQLHANTTSAKN